MNSMGIPRQWIAIERARNAHPMYEKRVEIHCMANQLLRQMLCKMTTTGFGELESKAVPDSSMGRGQKARGTTSTHKNSDGRESFLHSSLDGFSNLSYSSRSLLGT
mmetsp:Transcript_6726/g.41102  ORF Transcript_6726/g.41102 Transcript_6726/m.41102 type:complete len:106 (-) Transcript_6726:908-1225(-)